MAKPSKKSARQSLIVSAVSADPAVRIRDLAMRHGVTSETIRRDLQELDAAGALLRTYGGAVRNAAPEGIFAERMARNIPARQAICEAALGLMGEVLQLFICGGSTAVHFARALAPLQKTPLTVVTQSFAVARELSANPLIRVQILPGIFDADEGIMHGPDTLRAISHYHAPLVIMTASGLSAEGISEGLENYAHAHAAMIAASDRVLLLAEAGKFDQKAFLRIADWSPGIHVVSDAPPSAALEAHLRDRGVALTIAPPLPEKP